MNICKCTCFESTEGSWNCAVHGIAVVKKTISKEEYEQLILDEIMQVFTNKLGLSNVQALGILEKCKQAFLED